MQRREFITLLGGVAVGWPLAANAQQPPRFARIGVLVLTQADADTFGKVLRTGLRDVGYIEGQNTVFHIRSADGNVAALQSLAVELVRLKVDVIVTVYTPCALAAKQATADIPIVAAVVGGPVEMGLVASLSRPGGNITGLSSMGPEAAGKCVELFHDMIPSLRRVGVLANPVDPFTKPFLEQIRLAGRASGIEIKPIALAGGADDLETALAAIAKESPDAVIVQGIYSPKVVADFAIRYRLPSASIVPVYARAGGLMSYGADVPDLFRHTATFVQKILQGSKPTDLPVEQPTKFNLTINLKTAKTLGLTVPPQLLARADEVIE